MLSTRIYFSMLIATLIGFRASSDDISTQSGLNNAGAQNLPDRYARWFNEGVQLNRQNVGKQEELSFTITANKREQQVHFNVSIQTNAPPPIPMKNGPIISFSSTAVLEVFDDTNKIASCYLAKSLLSDVYEFDVSLKYLTKSKFRFRNVLAVNGESVPQSYTYWFYLKDFVDEK
jgi:hypothetical protein